MKTKWFNNEKLQTTFVCFLLGGKQIVSWFIICDVTKFESQDNSVSWYDMEAWSWELIASCHDDYRKPFIAIIAEVKLIAL